MTSRTVPSIFWRWATISNRFWPVGFLGREHPHEDFGERPMIGRELKEAHGWVVGIGGGGGSVAMSPANMELMACRWSARRKPSLSGAFALKGFDSAWWWHLFLHFSFLYSCRSGIVRLGCRAVGVSCAHRRLGPPMFRCPCRRRFGSRGRSPAGDSMKRTVEIRIWALPRRYRGNASRV